ncbi:hypothetical protein COO60DRAFT_1167412 [Scenedesmus sp. NREL 46B-D3]|nr:hypothetical protein COO60DRAFT_1167412 [Scenedesmus sp. NREL 46B-D3]
MWLLNCLYECTALQLFHISVCQVIAASLFRPDTTTDSRYQNASNSPDGKEDAAVMQSCSKPGQPTRRLKIKLDCPHACCPSAAAYKIQCANNETSNAPSLMVFHQHVTRNQPRLLKRQRPCRHSSQANHVQAQMQHCATHCIAGSINH